MWWFKLWDLDWVFPSIMRQAYEQWKPASRGSFFFNKVWHSMFFTIAWPIWRKRNARCFNQLASSIAQIQDLILLWLSWWISGWEDPFPYTSNDIIRNPCHLQWSQSSSSKTASLSVSTVPRWLLPPPSLLKWNGYSSLTRSAISGVLRYHRGNLKCLFSRPTPLMNINNAQVLVIHRALKIFLASRFMGEFGLVIESDSANAVKWCIGENNSPWNLNF